MKTVKSIEDKNEELLNAIKDKADMKSKNDWFYEDLTPKAITLIKEIKSIEENVDYNKLSFTGGNKKVYGLDSFRTFEKLIKDIRNKNMTIDKAEVKQNKFAEKLDGLRAYPARGSKYVDLKESVLKNAKNSYDGWEKLLMSLKTKYIWLIVMKHLKKKLDTKTKKRSEKKEEKRSLRNENGLSYYEKLDRLVALRKRHKWWFSWEALSSLLSERYVEKLKESKTIPERNKIQVNMIKSGLRDLTKEIEDMSK